MTENDAAGEGDRVAFYLDEESVPETFAVSANADKVADVVAFDLDENGATDAIVVDVDQNGVADVAAFDLDETDGTTQESWNAEKADEVTDEDQDEALSDDSLVTPPDDVTNEDMDQAQSDMRHMEAMNEYMWDQGLTDVP